MRQRKVCGQGHVFYKTPGCDACPKCEAARRPADGFMAGLAAPARRALEGAGLTRWRYGGKQDQGDESQRR